MENRGIQQHRCPNDHMRCETDRRFVEDRRSNHKMPDTPFTDSEGRKVRCDRRRMPDRRINNIQVEWLEQGDQDSA